MTINRYPIKKAIEKLSKDLGLKVFDNYSQDWENEVSDKTKIADFISYYKTNELNDDEKITLMSVIIASCNEAVGENILEKSQWDDIEIILLNEADIHSSIIDYWACNDDDIEDCFYITPMVRSIQKNAKLIQYVSKIRNL